ncbi:hypothetical protein FEM48_Zijuj01G0107900 [Ziziphus jujuba var. spinosa]|uniref:KIB1-4 beta-propeller domain-containing protein n=1 Tax=Ziziphus jujuba var. spinosa TaxID=714518 RepID=A0A978W0U0_ZIZJJ|nr:hypothetical protein FEM48_Zijuj01G0107900 [Ziziphus jujuba var. spinosa]
MNSSLRERRQRSESEWSTLGTDLLEEILKRFLNSSRTDTLRLRAICKGWRSSIPFPPIPNHLFSNVRLPLKLPFPTTTNFEGKGHFSVKQSTIYSMEPVKVRGRKPKFTRECFVKIEETDSGKVLLKDPFSRLTIENLGKLTGSLPKVINLLDYRVKLFATEYRLESVQGTNPPKEVMGLKKAVVGQDKKDGEELFAVMVLHISGKLGVWKMGQNRWVEIDDGFCYLDITSHKGMFYAVDSTRRIIAVDSSSLDITLVVPPTITFRS